MVQGRPTGATREWSRRKTPSSLQTTLGAGYVPWAPIFLHAFRQRGKRRLDPAAIGPAGDTIIHGIGSSYGPRCTRGGGHQGRGMQASASCMADRWGPARRAWVCKAERPVAEAGTARPRSAGSRRANQDAASTNHVVAPAIFKARAVRCEPTRPVPVARFDVRLSPRCGISRALNVFLVLTGEDSSAWAQYLVVLRRSQMLSLPSLLGDSRRCATAGLASHVEGRPVRIGAAFTFVGRVKVAWLDPVVTPVLRRRPTTGRSVPQRR
jgi:hypothetical protein